MFDDVGVLSRAELDQLALDRMALSIGQNVRRRFLRSRKEPSVPRSHRV